LLVSIEEENLGWFVGICRVFTQALYIFDPRNLAGLE
jgi:hypothetical protein